MTDLLTQEQVKAAVASAITHVRGDVSKRELARRIGVTPNYVVQWEQGKGVEERFVYAIDRALGLTEGTVFRIAGERLSTEPRGDSRKGSRRRGWYADSPLDRHLYPRSVDAQRTLAAAA